jgi:hypothetical protein
MVSAKSGVASEIRSVEASKRQNDFLIIASPKGAFVDEV